MFALWGRKVQDFLPIAKTTMMVEAHWSQLKRVYLLPHNRPRCDFLVYILSVKMLPKCAADFEMLCSGNKVPAWWRHFANEWSRLSATAPINEYKTNRLLWTCSCKGFMNSKVLLCKHLTYELSCPQYRDEIRSRSPPFLQIKRRENCFRAIFAGEDKVSTFSPVLTGHLRPTIGEILISPDPRHITGFFPSHQGADGVESMREKAT